MALFDYQELCIISQNKQIWTEDASTERELVTGLSFSKKKSLKGQSAMYFPAAKPYA